MSNPATPTVPSLDSLALPARVVTPVVTPSGVPSALAALADQKLADFSQIPAAALRDLLTVTPGAGDDTACALLEQIIDAAVTLRGQIAASRYAAVPVTVTVSDENLTTVDEWDCADQWEALRRIYAYADLTLSDDARFDGDGKVAGFGRIEWQAR